MKSVQRDFIYIWMKHGLNRLPNCKVILSNGKGNPVDFDHGIIPLCQGVVTLDPWKRRHNFSTLLLLTYREVFMCIVFCGDILKFNISLSNLRVVSRTLPFFSPHRDISSEMLSSFQWSIELSSPDISRLCTPCPLSHIFFFLAFSLFSFSHSFLP